MFTPRSNPSRSHRGYRLLVPLLGIAALLLIPTSHLLASVRNYYDDIEDADRSAWQIVKFGYYQDTVSWDLVQDGSQVWQAAGGLSVGGGGSIAYLNNLEFSDTIIVARIKIHEVRNGGHHSGVVSRFQDPDNYYELFANRTSSLLILSKWSEGSQETLDSASLPTTWLDSWFTLKLEVVGPEIKAYANGQLKISITDETHSAGSAGLKNGGCVTRFDDVKITSSPDPETDAFLRSSPLANISSLAAGRISAVMDHHVPREGVPTEWRFPYTCMTSASCQTVPNPCADAEGFRKVRAFDNQLGDSLYGENDFPAGYRQSCTGEHFLFPEFIYAGSASGATGFFANGSTDPAAYLDYDGHPGYDFNYPGDSDLGEFILAVAAGWLEIPEEDFLNAPCSGDPQQYNALRIVHMNGFESWYLHAIESSECIAFIGEACIEQDDRPLPGKFIWVEAGDRIAQLGGTGTASPHLHFEVRVSTTQQPVDPFGCASETAAVDPKGCQSGNLWALLFRDGFESGDTTAWSSTLDPSKGLTVHK